jgi:vitamin B12 transporter
VEFNRDGTVPRVDAPSYTLVNVTAEYRIDEHLTAFGRVDNLLNTHYENPIGFDAPGIGVYGGMRLTN